MDIEDDMSACGSTIAEDKSMVLSTPPSVHSSSAAFDNENNGVFSFKSLFTLLTFTDVVLSMLRVAPELEEEERRPGT